MKYTHLHFMTHCFLSTLCCFLLIHLLFSYFLPHTAVGGGSFSTDKLLEMSQQFQKSTASTADADVDGKGFAQAQNAFTDLVFDTQGNYVQELILEEAAKMTDATVRQSIQTLRKSPGGRVLKAAIKAPTDLVSVQYATTPTISSIHEHHIHSTNIPRHTLTSLSISLPLTTTYPVVPYSPP